ncbi:MAG: FtsH protease activity modulator HflK [Candidatus Omnitrophica bacterium]|nr:FtsH protease activity modulator HflK [Candidatus Omnitrophota bacterium]
MEFNLPPRGGKHSQSFPKFQPRHWLILIVLGLLLTGVESFFYQVDQDEAGVVQRFGQYVRTTPPGLHMKLPFGIESVSLIKVTHIFKEEFGFRTVSAGIRTAYEGRDESVMNGRSDPFLQESLMLTGDLNSAAVEWIVQYKIHDPVKYTFNIRDARETLRNISEAVMRLVVGDHTISEVLTSGREDIQRETKAKLQQILDSYDSGISIGNVILQEVTPPNEVKPSFNEVNEARQEKEKLVNQAWAEYNRIIPKAKGEAEQTIRNAEGYALERINQAKGDAERFALTWEAYQKFPQVTRRRLYLEMAEKVFPNLKDKLLLDQSQQGILPLLNLNPPGQDKKEGEL